MNIIIHINTAIKKVSYLSLKVTLLLFINIFGGINNYANAQSTIEYKEVKNQDINFISEKFPKKTFRIFDDSSDEKRSPGKLQIVFFNDSFFIRTPMRDLQDINYEEETILNRYFYVNDSVIELNFSEEFNAPQIILSHNKTLEDSLKVKVMNPQKPINQVGKGLKWSLMRGDSLISEKEAFSDESGIKWLVGIYYDVESSKKISDVLPDKIIIYSSFDMVWGEAPFKTYMDTVTYCYAINIEDAKKNYLDVIDMREFKNDTVNDVLIKFDSMLYKWYPNKLRFKKKKDQLVLLNHDGSESEVVLNILN